MITRIERTHGVIEHETGLVTFLVYAKEGETETVAGAFIQGETGLRFLPKAGVEFSKSDLNQVASVMGVE